uniref:Uncharacterized protein n=1 Tax=Mola mola TaxID=94237 RepID=A0A3Q3VRB3_MOLML
MDTSTSYGLKPALLLSVHLSLTFPCSCLPLSTLPAVKHGGGSVKLCGCGTDSGTGNTAEVEERIYSTKYQKIKHCSLFDEMRYKNVFLNVRRVYF